MFLLNSRLGPFTAASVCSWGKPIHILEALLLPKIRSYFAEFLNVISLKRLGILYQSTCVGLGYDLMEGYFQGLISGPSNPIRRNNLHNPSPSPGPGILTWFPSSTPFGLDLGVGLPCSD